MPFSAFYRSKNEKELHRVDFEGTTITVFELKREIIQRSGLAKEANTDFHILREHDSSVYEDDTELISPSSTVITQRRPAASGRGNIVRYMNGKVPQRAFKKATSAVPDNGNVDTSPEAAFLAESSEAWKREQEQLSKAKPVYNKKNANVPSGPPPAYYTCRICNEKGHYIQQCPTKDDPNHKSYKLPTGIPKSFQKEVTAEEADGPNVMKTPDGRYVQVKTDANEWNKFQQKTNAVKAQEASADAAMKELRERGLQCSIDERMFVDPMKTPCCGQTFCRQCIESALEEGDLVCPHCNEEEVLVDNLVKDEEMVNKIREYQAEKAAEKMEAAAKQHNEQIASDSSKQSTDNSAPAVVDANSSPNSKKRKSPPTEIQPPTAPKAMRQPTEEQVQAEFQAQMDQMFRLPMNMPGMPMNMSMPMNMNMSMPMMPPQQQMPMQNPMMNMGMGMGGYGNGMANGNGNGWGAQQGFHHGHGWNQHAHQAPPQQQPGIGIGMNMMNMNMNMGGFQGNNNGLQDAYERQPVNNRQRNKRAREPDYRTLH